jgi:hypothetical protein
MYLCGSRRRRPAVKRRHSMLRMGGGGCQNGIRGCALICLELRSVKNDLPLSRSICMHTLAKLLEGSRSADREDFFAHSSLSLFYLSLSLFLSFSLSLFLSLSLSLSLSLDIDIETEVGDRDLTGRTKKGPLILAGVSDLSSCHAAPGEFTHPQRLV